MADCSFEKSFRLLSASDFKNLRDGSLSFKKPALIVYFKKNSFNQTRIGISASRKVGKSTVRNRCKRLIREHFRQSNMKLSGYDILFVISWSRNLGEISFDEKEKLLTKNVDQFFQFAAREFAKNSSQLNVE